MTEENTMKGTLAEGIAYNILSVCGGEHGQHVGWLRVALASYAAAVRAEGAAEKDAEWRRGYNQGWDERKAFDQPGGALPAPLLKQPKA